MIHHALGVTLVLPTMPAARAVQQEASPPATPESQGIQPEALAELIRPVGEYVEGRLNLGGELLGVKNRQTFLHETFGHADLSGAVLRRCAGGVGVLGRRWGGRRAWRIALDVSPLVQISVERAASLKPRFWATQCVDWAG